MLTASGDSFNARHTLFQKLIMFLKIFFLQNFKFYSKEKGVRKVECSHCHDTIIYAGVIDKKKKKKTNE